ncbi:MAG: hypothetical protein U9Q85_03010 [Patescibacteria group bacterium]|nr:hypothetical protein [Patescibacteria group bacterium]
MINYLEKYNNLPDNVKAGVSTPEITVAIEDLEKEYNVTLATVVMRVLVKDISLVDLPKFFVFEYDMNPRRAEKLVETMQTRIFKSVGAHLGFSIDSVKDESDDISKEEKIRNKARNDLAGAPIRSSNFFFSSEDEEEVKELTQKLEIDEVESADVKRESEEQLNLEVDKIVDKSNLNFSSEELHQRFRKIIFTYKKGVRNRIDTKQTMLKDVGKGGLGLNDMLANKAIKIADNIKDEIKDENKKEKEADESTKKPQPIEISTIGERDAPYDFQSLQKPVESDMLKKEKHLMNVEQEKNAGKHEDKKVSWEEINKRTSKEDPGAQTQEKKEKTKVKITAEEAPALEDIKENKSEDRLKDNPIVINRPQASTGGRIVDVKRVPKLSGPVDELKDFDLLNFRRLSSNPAKACAKIKEKLKFLEEDSYEKRLQGIKAWRASAVNKEYLAIGQESIAENKEIEDVISVRKKTQQNTLSYSEFLAIMDLNRSIRF